MQHSKQTPNRLSKALSPYLLQHAFNPVDWHEWGEEAFELAKRDNKLLLLSIGYSACHWCHVMAHESFEDEETARMMNEMFVCIKVDREELPDVDQVYMDACQLINGSGGWPLNAFALPDKRPVHALTYLPRNQWQKLLQNIHRIWANEPQTIYGYAEKMAEGIANISMPPQLVKLERSPKISGSALQAFIAQYDEVHGGPNRAPKFPMPNNYRYLLQHSVCLDESKSREMALFTLSQMALGGIYDVVGGGFARYSVDAKWFAPHFEKMLYDNAQLLSLYSYAHAVSGKAPYKHIALQISDFCRSEMMGPEGLYYSAYDADSEGVEGLYYTYTYLELEQELGSDSTLFCQYFQCTRAGNWEHGRNILYAIDAIDKAAETFEVSEKVLSELINKGLQKLKVFRNGRIKPGLDDKYICSWNCLAAKALAESAIWLNDAAMAGQASLLTLNILENFYREGSLKRICKSGSEARIDAFIEDHAMLIDALICVYQATFNEEILLKARELCVETVHKFLDEKRGFFRFNESQTALATKYDISDDVINSGNSTMAHNLWRLSWYFDKREWKEIADNMLDAMLPLVENNAPWYSNWAALQLMRECGTKQVILSGDEPLRKTLPLKSYYKWPNAVFGFAGKETAIPLFGGKEYAGTNLLYQCEDFVCHEPTAFEAQKL